MAIRFGAAKTVISVVEAANGDLDVFVSPEGTSVEHLGFLLDALKATLINLTVSPVAVAGAKIQLGKNDGIDPE